MRPRGTSSGLLVACLVAGCGIAGHRPCAGDETPGGSAAWFDEMTLNGLVSSSFSYNFNRPGSGTNQLRVFDFDDNTFKLDEFELVAQKAVSKPRDTGFRMDLTLGSSVSRVTASAGLFRDALGVAEDIDVHQAFASYIAPLGSGLRFDAGKFITGHGYEVIDGYDGWNDNATRSFLFGYAIPFTHVGLRASYAFTPRVAGVVMVVNGWDVARDNNRSKSVGAQLTVTPSSPLTVIVTGMTGPERPGNDSDRRDLLDIVAIAKVSGWLTLGANADWGNEEDALGAGRDGGWSGAAGYARVVVNQTLAVSVRGEYFHDRDGVRMGVAQRLEELTVTPELRLLPRLLLRGDLRRDHSDQRVFEKSPDFSRTQPTGLLQVIYAF